MMSTPFRMVSCKYGNTAVRLYTTEMPNIAGFNLGYQYESCVFYDEDSEVLGRYQTLSEAIAGHNDLKLMLGLNHEVDIY